MVVATAEPARPRSRTVTLALGMMVFCALLSAAVAAMFIRDYVTYAAVAAKAGAATGSSQSRVSDDVATQHLIDGFCAGSFALIALVLLATAAWARAASAGRVLACIASAGQALCCGGMMAYLSLGISLLDVNGDDPYLDEAFRVQYAAQPGWAKALIPTATALLPLLGITTLVLLLVPSSNRYYRKEPPPGAQALPYYPTPVYGPTVGYGAQPPVAYGPSPAYGPPGYGAAPGYEPPPQFPAPPPADAPPPPWPQYPPPA